MSESPTSHREGSKLSACSHDTLRAATTATALVLVDLLIVEDDCKAATKMQQHPRQAPRYTVNWSHDDTDPGR